MLVWTKNNCVRKCFMYGGEGFLLCWSWIINDFPAAQVAWRPHILAECTHTHTIKTLFSSETENSLVLSSVIGLWWQLDFDLAVVLPLVLVLVLVRLLRGFLGDIVWPLATSYGPVVVVVFIRTTSLGAPLKTTNLGENMNILAKIKKIYFWAKI